MIREVILIACVFVVLGALVVSRVSGASLRETWFYFALGLAGVLGIIPLALGMAFALYTFLPVVIALPIIIAMARRQPHRHVRTVPTRFRKA